MATTAHLRITSAQKSTYKLRSHLTSGVWMGTCPTCKKDFTAQSFNDPQRAVVETIVLHEEKNHAE